MPPVTVNRIPVACIAPDLTDEVMVLYKSLITALPSGELKDCLVALYNCVEKWWGLPESTSQDIAHWEFDNGQTRVVEQKLEQGHKEALEPHVPWMRELNAMEPLLDSIPNDDRHKPLRDCAFHLLWHCKELTLDREPITRSKLIKHKGKILK